MNFTLTGNYHNYDNLICIRSPQLAESYTVEFEEMFLEDRFGYSSPRNTPYQKVLLGDSVIEVYFSPEDGTKQRLLELIQGARESIHILAFAFTDDELAEALAERSRNGLQVAGVFEKSQVESNIGGEYDRLRSDGIDVHLDGKSNKMHHKVMIIDEEIVVTGSYNFSYSAQEKNDENTLVIHDEQVDAEFLEEFYKIYAEAK